MTVFLLAQPSPQNQRKIIAEGYEDTIAIPVGAFAEPGFPAPARSVWERDKHAWIVLPENIEHIW
jgi:hypothetical protein